MRFRLFNRIYLGLTTVFYAVIGILLAVRVPNLTPVAGQETFWACAFLMVGSFTFVGWVDEQYRFARVGLICAAAVALGFGIAFMAHALSGQLQYALGAVMWFYISGSHASFSRLADPHVLALFEREVADLERRIRRAGE